MKCIYFAVLKGTEVSTLAFVVLNPPTQCLELLYCVVNVLNLQGLTSDRSIFSCIEAVLFGPCFLLGVQ